MRWIEEVVRREGKAEPQFKEYDVLMFLSLLKERRKISRKEISENLSIGEGSTRTMLRKLSEMRIVEITPRGVIFSEKGKKLWEEIRRKLRIFRNLSCGDLTVGKFNFGILLKDSSHLITNGLEQRDAGVFAGGDGATTIVFRDGRVEIAGMGYEREAEEVMRGLNAEEGDVLIIGTGRDERRAEKAAWAAAYTVIKRWRNG